MTSTAVTVRPPEIFTYKSSGARLIAYARYLPAAFVAAGLGLVGAVAAWVFPVSARMLYDPSMQYLLSSLAWFRGRGFTYVDHPGTPLEIVGVLLMGVTYPVLHATNHGFVDFYLRHPQLFLSAAQSFAVFANAMTAVVVARYSIAATNFPQVLIGAAIGSLFFVVQSDGFRNLTLWSYESFYFPAGTLHSLLLLLVVRRPSLPTWRAMLLLGAASGGLMSFHLYFAAWVVGTAVALGIAVRLRSHSWLRAVACSLIVCLAAAVGFGIATLPIHERFGQLVGWAWLNSTQGTYGLGTTGLVGGPFELARTLVRLVRSSPGLFIACGAASLLLILQLWRTRRTPQACPAIWAAGVGLLLQILVLLTLSVVHPGLGGGIGRYLPSAAAALPVLCAASLDKLDRWPARMQYITAAAGLAVLAFFGVSVQSALTRQSLETEWLRYMDLQTEEMLANLAQERQTSRESLRTLWTYGTTPVCYALWMGDDADEHTFHNDIANVCPRDGELQLWGGLVPTSNGFVKLADYHDWDVLVLTDGFLADLFPEARPAGSAHPSSIGTWGYGNLVFVTPN